MPGHVRELKWAGFIIVLTGQKDYDCLSEVHHGNSNGTPNDQ
jgi:hypothetical protein